MAALCNFSELQKHDRFVSPSGSPSCEGKLVLRRANRRLSFSLRREERVSGLRAPCGDLPGLPILPGTLAKVVQGSSDRRQAALSSARRLFPEPTSAPEVGARGLPVVSSHRLPGLPSVREPRARPGRRCSQRGVQSVSVRRAAKFIPRASGKGWAVAPRSDSHLHRGTIHEEATTVMCLIRHNNNHPLY
ncbi:Membrane-associated guanylate kinase, WW and PDZ domain-containing protein 2 [Manis javanica]|nr:Membrane-associated guanylate kinase, WW and PDZ domain-containing protein 2 [Manis javanica]